MVSGQLNNFLRILEPTLPPFEISAFSPFTAQFLPVTLYNPESRAYHP